MATYYVSPSGSDGANGSSGTPWKTLTKASNAVSPGDTVRVLPGTYTEAVTLKTANVTWRADNPSNRPVIDGTYHPGLMNTAELQRNTVIPRADVGYLNRGGSGALIDINASGVTVDGFVTQNSAGKGIDIGASNVTVRNVATFWTFGPGIFANPPTPISGLLVENFDVLFSSMMRFEPNRREYMGCKPTDECVSGAVKFSRVQSLILRNGRVAYSGGEGVNIGKYNYPASGVYIVVEKLIVHDNNHTHIYVNASKQVIVRNCIVYCGGAEVNLAGNGAPAGIRVLDEKVTEADDVWIYNNVVVNMGMPISVGGRHTLLTRFYMGYNTVVGGPEALYKNNKAISVRAKDGGGNQRGIVENNLVDYSMIDRLVLELSSGTGANGTMFRNNAWSSLPVAGGRSTGDVVGDVKLVNPRAALRTTNYLTKAQNSYANFQTSNNFNLANYRLTKDSPAIGRASARTTFNNVTPPAAALATDLENNTRTDFNPAAGRYWDMGAFEYGGIVAPPEDEIDANFTQSATSGQAPLTVNFTDTSTESGAAEVDTWLWDFGDGYTSTAQNPSHTYATPGTYTPQLTATDASSGLSDSRVGSPIVVQAPPPPGEGEDVAIRQVRAALRTTNGNQTFSQSSLGGLTPKSARFIATGATADGVAADGEKFGYGFTAGGAQVAAAIAATHGVADTLAARFSTDQACLVLIDGSGNQIVRLTFVDWTTNGVIVNVQWIGTPAAYLVTVVLGAGDAYRAWVGAVRVNGVGTLSPVTCGFEPHAVQCAATWGALGTAPGDASLSLGLGHRLGAAYVLERTYATAQIDGMNHSRLFSGFIAHSRYALPNGRGGVVVSSWGSNGLTLSVTNDAIDASVLMLAERYGQVSSDVALVTTAATTPHTLGWDPQYVQHLISPATAVGAFNDNLRAGTIGLHTVTADGEFSNQVSGENASATTNEQSLSDDQFIVVNHAGGTLAAGATTLGAGQYSIAYSTSPGTPLAMVMLAVEGGEAEDGGGDYVTAEFESDVMLGPVPLRVVFQDLSAGTNPIISWLWDFGDGSTSTEQNPVHVYRSGGDFTVTLTVSDGTLDGVAVKEAYISAVEPTKRRIRVGPFMVRPVTESSVSQTHWDADSEDCGYMDVGLQLNALRLNVDPGEQPALPDEISIYNDAASGDLKVKRPDDSEGTIDVA